jgi:hypothetical protein
MNENNTSVEQSAQKPTKENAAARWRKLIEQQRESGLPVSAYCRERGLSAASMFAWKRRLRPKGALPVEQTFKPVTLVPGPQRLVRDVEEQPDSPTELPACFIELCLRGERRLIVRRGFDHQLLAELIQVMESLA